MTAHDTLKHIIDAGSQKLHLLSDFDRTLTKPFVNGKPVASLISILGDHGYLSPKYSKKAQEFFDTYGPIELDPNVPVEEKRIKMKEWWTRHFALLIESGLTKQHIEQAMRARHAELRDGAPEFFKALLERKIPLVIMSSSGLGIESISLFLEHEKMLFPNIHIISNQYIWNPDGKALGVKEPIIHGMNKDETLVSSFPEIYREVHDRTNVIMIGDNDSDLGMITGFDYQNLYTIGFGKAARSFNLKLDENAPLDAITDIIKGLR